MPRRGGVDLAFDGFGGDIGTRSAGPVRAVGTLVTIAGPPRARPTDGLAVDFVVVPDRAELSEIGQRVRDGRVRTNIGKVAALDDAVAAFNPTGRVKARRSSAERAAATPPGRRCPPHCTSALA
jgi:NADPH:quinone reductase-like Zn-dependent oxidoreductase